MLCCVDRELLDSVRRGKPKADRKERVEVYACWPPASTGIHNYTFYVARARVLENIQEE